MESRESRRIAGDPPASRGAKWKPLQAFRATGISATRRRWLLDEGSLTAHLVAASRGNFRVEVLSQTWGRAALHEAQLLGIAPRRICLLREVLLLCNDRPWVFARSVLPESSLRGGLRHLRRFGNQPLGQLLFNDSNLQRRPFELAIVNAADIAALQRAGLPELSRSGELLGRRSKFLLQGKALMVSEIFLEAFWQGMPDQAHHRRKR